MFIGKQRFSGILIMQVFGLVSRLSKKSMFAVCNATRTCLAKFDSACVQHGHSGLGRNKARFSLSVNKNKLKRVNFWTLDGRHVTKNAWTIP